MKEIWTSFCATVIGWMDVLLKAIGSIWYPLRQWIVDQPEDTLIYMAGTAALFALLILLQRLHSRSKKRKALRSAVTKHLSDRWWVIAPMYIGIALYVFYPLILMWLGMQFTDMGMGESGLLGGAAALTFGNFTEWGWIQQFVAVSAALWAAMNVLICVLRLHPVELLRFAVQTVAYAWLGRLIGALLLWMSGLGWLLRLLSALTVLFLTFVLPIFFSLVALLPLFELVLLLLYPVFWVLARFDDGREYTYTTTWVVRYADGREVPLLDESGNLKLLVLLDALL